MQKVIIMLCSLCCCAYGMEQQSMSPQQELNNAGLDMVTDELEDNRVDEEKRINGLDKCCNEEDDRGTEKEDVWTASSNSEEQNDWCESRETINDSVTTEVGTGQQVGKKFRMSLSMIWSDESDDNNYGDRRSDIMRSGVSNGFAVVDADRMDDTKVMQSDEEDGVFSEMEEMKIAENFQMAMQCAMRVTDQVKDNGFVRITKNFGLSAEQSADEQMGIVSDRTDENDGELLSAQIEEDVLDEIEQNSMFTDVERHVQTGFYNMQRRMEECGGLFEDVEAQMAEMTALMLGYVDGRLRRKEIIENDNKAAKRIWWENNEKYFELKNQYDALTGTTDKMEDGERWSLEDSISPMLSHDKENIMSKYNDVEQRIKACRSMLNTIFRNIGEMKYIMCEIIDERSGDEIRLKSAKEYYLANAERCREKYNRLKEKFDEMKIEVAEGE